MKFNKPFIISSLLMLAAIFFSRMIITGTNMKVANLNLYDIPNKIGEYVGSTIEMDQSVVNELNTDIYLFRNYTKMPESEITLYLGYYGTEKGGRTGHNPLACYPGGGWSIVEKNKVKIPIKYINGKEINISLNALKVKKENTLLLVYYWYQNSDKILSSGLDQNIFRAKNILFNNRNDGAFLRLSTTINNNYEFSVIELNNFFKELYPLIIKYWPVEKEN